MGEKLDLSPSVYFYEADGYNQALRQESLVPKGSVVLFADASRIVTSKDISKWGVDEEVYKEKLKELGDPRFIVVVKRPE